VIASDRERLHAIVRAASGSLAATLPTLLNLRKQAHVARDQHHVSGTLPGGG
jgi:hypothetical protein